MSDEHAQRVAQQQHDDANASPPLHDFDAEHDPEVSSRASKLDRRRAAAKKAGSDADKSTMKKTGSEPDNSTTAAKQTDDANQSAKAQRAPIEGPGIAHSEAGSMIYRAREFMQTTSDALLPAFHAAVNALDAPAALQLAQACAQGLGIVFEGYDRAKSRTSDADPAARVRCEAGKDCDTTAAAPTPEPWEYEAHNELAEKLRLLQIDVHAFGKRVATEMSPQIFRGLVVGDGVKMPPGADISPYEAAVRESSITVDLIITHNHIRDLLGPFPWFSSGDKRKEAVTKVEMWKGRPISFQFLKHILSVEGLWNALTSSEGESGRTLATTDTKVKQQEAATGGFGDVGEWDASRANSALSRGATDWAVTDEDAEKVFEMITSAAPATRGGLVLQLDRMGKLGRLCDNLPWRWVQQLHDVVDDPAAKAKLRPHFVGKGGGESLSKVYERKIMENIEEDQLVRAYLWTFLDTAHSGLTFGFKDVHDPAYDAAEEGWISSDAYLSATAKGLGRAAAMMAATAVTGGAAGAWGEGAALGLGAGKTTAQIIGGAIGGGVAGVGGQFTGDVYDQLLMGKQGFSSAGDYAVAGVTGAATGALTAGVQAAGSKYLPQSVKTMSQVYAERYPGLDNTLTRIRNAGVRDGLVLRVSGQELGFLVKSGLANHANLQGSLSRIGMVYRNDRIDVSSRTLAKVHPQSEIQKMYGDVDPATGRVNVRNTDPSSGGYVADADRIPAANKTTDQGMRDTLGIDGPVNWYDKYKNPADPLFEVTFRVGVELDTPLPQTEAPGTQLGVMNPDSHHMTGTGHTKGGVPEGILPRGTPIEIIDIVPVGTPRASYPDTGATYSPYPTASPAVRNLPAPVAGGTSGMTSSAAGDLEPLDIEREGGVCE